ncbi:MAG: peptidylprolyl isomerase [Oscillospiraceae bacterium]|nr:peptidylprolyl isomerase [Oscillospiraceae bacterium]
MKNPTAKIFTDFGVITMEIYPQYVPNTAHSFIWSAQQGFYKNRLIKRVVKDFVLQPSYCHFDDANCDFMIEGEYAQNGFDNPIQFAKYVVAMAGDGEKESHGCEFYITLSDGAASKLQGHFAPFGKVTAGFDVVDKIASVAVKDVKIDGVSAVIKQPLSDIYMQNVEIETYGESYPHPQVKYWIEHKG